VLKNLILHKNADQPKASVRESTYKTITDTDISMYISECDMAIDNAGNSNDNHDKHIYMHIYTYIYT
jgi:hypothetical protein